MSDDEDHTVTDQLLGGGDRLFGIAEVVRRDQPHLLAEDAAGGVDVGHGQLRAALHCSPYQAFCPVIGPATPIRTSARAGQPSAEANMTMATAAKRHMIVLPRFGDLLLALLQRHVGAVRCQTYQYQVLHGEVALLVEVDRAHHGVELVFRRDAIIAWSSSEPAFSAACAHT